MSLDKHLKVVKRAMKVLVDNGWVVARTELTADIEDGEQLVLVLRYDPIRATDIL